MNDMMENTAELELEADELDCETEENIFIVEEMPEEGYDIDSARKVIEAVLFAAGHPVTYNKLAQVLETTPGVVKKVVKDYTEEYNSETYSLPRGIMMLSFDDSCQLCTKEQYGTQIREALGIKRGGNLSQSSIEALAVIAYNEPVTRAFVDTVRGVDSSYAITVLNEKNLIVPCGRLDVPGRPILYRTTDNFLRVFGISSLDELPDVPVPTSPIQEKIVFDEAEAETEATENNEDI